MINLIVGNFYFITNQYFHDFPDDKLMSNKEIIDGQEHNRPCFYAIFNKNTGLYWLIPISSQVTKFEDIYDKKLLKYKEVDTIVFGFVLGKKKAFLIQNMFPIIPQYINNEYMDSVTHQPVIINERLHNELITKANKVLHLQRSGYRLIFPDVLKIESVLIAKLEVQKAQEEAANE